MDVVMHKMLRVIFGILKNRTEFNADVDAANQDRANEKQLLSDEQDNNHKKEISENLVRYSKTVDAALPICKCHAKKIKRQIPITQKE